MNILYESLLLCKTSNSEFYISDDFKMFVMKRFDILEDGTYLGFEDMCVLTARELKINMMEAMKSVLEL